MTETETETETQDATRTDNNNTDGHEQKQSASGSPSASPTSSHSPSSPISSLPSHFCLSWPVLLCVCVGGACGSMTRYGVLYGVGVIGDFPLDTFLCNVIGCFLLGVLHCVCIDVYSRALLLTGFVGSLTTMSSFMYDTSQLWQRDADAGMGVAYFLLTNIGGIVLTALGMATAALVLGARQPEAKQAAEAQQLEQGQSIENL